MPKTSPFHKLGLLALALPLVLCVNAGTAQAACDTYGGTQVSKLTSAKARSALECLINYERKKAHVRAISAATQLVRSATGHAKASIAQPFWSRTNGTVSHLDPGTPVPSDQQQLQDLANQQITQRIRGTGYCATGNSWGVGEITYGGVGTTSTPRAAVKWWMGDPPHKAALLNAQWQSLGAVGLKGSAFNPPDKGATGTFVVDFGYCS